MRMVRTNWHRPPNLLARSRCDHFTLLLAFSTFAAVAICDKISIVLPWKEPVSPVFAEPGRQRAVGCREAVGEIWGNDGK